MQLGWVIWHNGGMETKMYWEVEQLGVPLPLSEWTLLLSRPKMGLGFRSESCMAIMEVWSRLHKGLLLGQLVITSILNHPGSQVVKQYSNFRKWIQGGLHQDYQLVKEGKVLPKQEVLQLIGSSATIHFQYVQVKDF